MEPATKEMIERWKKIHEMYKNKLSPNRKSGKELVNYLKSRYVLTEIKDEKILSITTMNVLMNAFSNEKLPKGVSPNPVTYYMENEGLGYTLYEKQEAEFAGTKILIGIDLSSSMYYVEGSSLLWNELCAYQGLDTYDIENYYCVAEYIQCLEQFDMSIPINNQK